MDTRKIIPETYQKVGAFETEDGRNFPVLTVYGQIGANIMDMKDRSQEKYRYTSLLPGAHMYNENLLPGRFYGKPIVIVEGIYDCLSLYQCGVPTMAALTNELTFNKLRKIKRYTDRLVLWFDSDSGGESGLDRTLKNAKKLGLKSEVIWCNAAKDPNDLLVKDVIEFTRFVERIKKITGG